MSDNHRLSYRHTVTGFIAVLLAIVILASAADMRLAADDAAPAAAEQTNKIFMPMTMKNRPTRWDRDSLFGVQVYNDSRPVSRYYSSLMDSGATWLRVAVNWSAVEPTNTTPGGFLWQYADTPLGAAERPGGSGVRVIGTIETAPTWARYDSFKPDGPLNSAGMEGFKEFVGAIVERYDGDGYQDAPGSPIVDYWELYNEPDRRLDSTDGRWGQHPAEYAAMLAAAYPIIKSHNPDARVVFGGIAYDFFTDQGGPFVRSFLDEVLKAGGGNYFDIFNFHTYPAFAANWLPAGTANGGSGLYEKTQHLRQKLQSYGLNKPIIVTEAGWQSNTTPGSPGSEEIQSRYVAQLFIQSLAADLDVMIWWMLYDPGEGTGEYGLVNRDTVPYRKLSFTAYQTIINVMTGKEFARVLPAAETNHGAMEAYQFRDTISGRAYYVAWLNPVSSRETATLSVAAEQARIIDLYGATGPVIDDAADGADDGRVRVPVSGRPAYIEVLR